MTSTHAATVRYGSLTVPLSGQRRGPTKPFGYLAHDSGERSLIERLEHSRTPHRIVIDHHGNDSYDPNTHTIRWDPFSALLTTRRLAVARARSRARDGPRRRGPARVRRHADAVDFAYDNAEERRVILGSERHAALTPRREHPLRPRRARSTKSRARRCADSNLVPRSMRKRAPRVCRTLDVDPHTAMFPDMPRPTSSSGPTVQARRHERN